MRYDLIVVGGGPGGYTAALHAAAMNKTVLLVEKDALGGTCLNRGCIPTKALLRSADLYHTVAAEGEELGVTAAAAVSMTAMHRHATQVREQLRDGIAGLLKRGKVTVVIGEGRVTDAHTVKVNGESWEGEHILLAAGSIPAKPPIPGLDLPGVVSSDELLTGDGVDCQRLIIIGGGVIGVEFAQIYTDLGRAVTIVEALPRLLSTLDRELGQSLQMSLKKRGCQIYTGAMVQRIEKEGESLRCIFTGKDGESVAEGDCVLVCTGRRPMTAGLLSPELEAAMELQRGYIPVSERWETKVSGVYAVGDLVLGGIQLAHAAEAEGRNAVEAMFGVADCKAMSAVPSCVFTRPEIASVGLTADEAKEKGIAVTVSKNLTSANGKALIEGAERGFAKLVYEKETEKLLGAQLMCPHAGEMIGTLTACCSAGLTKGQMEETIYPHPTISEILCP
ncbi:MAG: dihydrolipoyl dehydrogenase [Eubacteriales bacterium]|nr:dihydrolipoyl dehydrogenase [Eubacteriales bacterium]